MSSAITAETLERMADAIADAPRFKWRWVTRERFEVFQVGSAETIAAFKTIADAERDAKQRTRIAVATVAVQVTEDYHKQGDILLNDHATRQITARKQRTHG